jgi:uncharacterized protein involved in exopolysaccharide biosynthesis/Mrp family chromosome partitioning ATPase
MQDRPSPNNDLSKLVASPLADEAQHLNYRDVSRFMKRYSVMIAAMTALATAASLLYALVAVPVYTAHAQILIESRLPQVLREQLGEASVALDSPQIESQIAVLRSQQLAQAVVEKLKLGEDSEFTPQPQHSFFASLFRGPAASTTPTTAEQKARTTTTIETLQRIIDIRRYGLSYVLDITATSKDPEKAARLANAIADAYLADQLKVKVSAARQATDWREDQVIRLREQMNKAARAVQEFRAKRDYRLAPTREAAAVDTKVPVSPPQPTDRRDAISLEELEVTAQAYRKIYETNLQSHIEAVQRQALQFNDARVITVASPPLGASFPKTRLLALFGLSMGALLGLGLAIVRHAFDRSISTPAQLEEGAAVACIGTVPPPSGISSAHAPSLRGTINNLLDSLNNATINSLLARFNMTAHKTAPRSLFRQALDAPGSRYGQSMRNIRASVNRIRKSDDLRIIGIGALEPGQNTGIFAANLGGLYATSGVRTLVIDLENRSDRFATQSPRTHDIGIAEILADAATLEASITPGQQGGPDLLWAGLQSPPNTAAAATINGQSQADAIAHLLQKTREHYGLVLVALPTLDTNSDTAQIATQVENVIILAEYGVTQTPRLANIVNNLRNSGTHVLGAILISTEETSE